MEYDELPKPLQAWLDPKDRGWNFVYEYLKSADNAPWVRPQFAAMAQAMEQPPSIAQAREQGMSAKPFLALTIHDGFGAIESDVRVLGMDPDGRTLALEIDRSNQTARLTEFPLDRYRDLGAVPSTTVGAMQETVSDALNTARIPEERVLSRESLAADMREHYATVDGKILGLQKRAAKEFAEVEGNDATSNRRRLDVENAFRREEHAVRRNLVRYSFGVPDTVTPVFAEQAKSIGIDGKEWDALYSPYRGKERSLDKQREAFVSQLWKSHEIRELGKQMEAAQSETLEVNGKRSTVFRYLEQGIRMGMTGIRDDNGKTVWFHPDKANLSRAVDGSLSRILQQAVKVDTDVGKAIALAAQKQKSRSRQISDVFHEVA
ncbi:hypothetical protein [Acidithiobacillus caldus]|uniref:hypothetical protein n=2 Tax=Acidithiobacillus caldus TaxID=33059 RepID=UPI0007D94B44|nr:hypothetical protein [Acidithiobacillus caldus]